MQLAESKTYVNLANAYAGECQARTRYEFMEYGARYNGYKTMSEIIDTIIYQEFNHARMLYTFIQQASDKPIKNIDLGSGFPFKQKWNVQENLGFAADDEHSEAVKIYPAFAKTARKEGFEDVAKLFENLSKVEAQHEKIFRELFTQMKEGTLYKKETAVTWKCADCGYEASGTEAWDECPLCKAKQGSVLLKLASLGCAEA